MTELRIRRREPRTLTAWQHNGDEHGRRPVWVCHATAVVIDGLVVIRRSGPQIIRPGEWLIRDADGGIEWMTDDEFRRKYEEVVT